MCVTRRVRELQRRSNSPLPCLTQMNGSSNARALDGGAVLHVHVTTRQKVVPNRKYHGTIVANCGAEQLTIDPQLDLTWCTPSHGRRSLQL